MQRIRLAIGLVALGVAATLVSPASVSATDVGPSKAGVIVWTNRADDGSEHLVIARTDGSHQRQVTPTTPDTSDIDAQISPDGRWIAYERDHGDSAATIHLVRPNGRDDHVVDVGCVDPCAGALSPTWLSETRIAFSLVFGPFDDKTGDAASAALYSARIDGTGVRRLSEAGIDGVYEDGSLRVSADRSYVTFRRTQNSDLSTALFRMTPDGSHLHQLTPYSLRADVNDLSTARLGPTKNLVVFESYGRGDPTQSFVDIATVPSTCGSLADCTSRIRWLTDNGATGRRNANPQWSPDGTSLVFTDRPSIDDPNAEIWTMRYPESARQKISTSPNFDYRPTWGVASYQSTQ